MDCPFREKVKHVMHKKKVTTADLASRIGYSRTTLHRWLSGQKATITTDTLWRLYNALGINITIKD